MVSRCLNAGGMGWQDFETETLIPTGGGFDAIPLQEVGKRENLKVGREGSGIGKVNDPMYTLQAGAQHAISIGLGSYPIHANEVAQPVTNRNGDPGVVAFSSKDHGADAGEIAPTLRGMGHDKSHENGGGQVAIAFSHSETPKHSAKLSHSLDAQNGQRESVCVCTRQ